METPDTEDDATPAGEIIDHHRQHIDRIDRTIVALLSERMRLGRALGEIKRAHAWPVRWSAREADVLARVRGAASGPLAPESAVRIFAAIIAETTAVQENGNE